MKLVGMLDSPYVRRTAISLRLLGLPFTHESVSVFREVERFRAVNPVVKAPSLVCDNGVVLMDSTLIIDYAESLAGRSLMPADTASRQAALRVVGLALAACEKVVQNFYEHSQRPAGKRHQPWLDRVDAQRESAFALLEAELAARPLPRSEAGIGQPELTAAVAWTFTQFMLPGAVDPALHPALARLAAALERLPAFEALPCA
ncbi:glutathione S-transferase family protein [Cupriavidus neocaledonicus]|uniref:Glutathione S-transferase n=1 Tax=Cupriavidus neocaledonicus TaxID=1040979 RepID=A0A375HVR9_9BURK|nr:glutathione S-transferase family protein [Cupriavidus neocaledonicus]SOZ39895.1 Glutathione S-transferase [Cupriavidus neocaledonicus]SPD60770.1 Glutathione S-transferase [Cupriavidus neocaledonicus]